MRFEAAVRLARVHFVALVRGARALDEHGVVAEPLGTVEDEPHLAGHVERGQQRRAAPTAHSA